MSLDGDRAREPARPERLSAEQTEVWRKRQKDRAVWMALILAALAVLIFFIAWRKMLAG